MASTPSTCRRRHPTYLPLSEETARTAAALGDRFDFAQASPIKTWPARRGPPQKCREPGRFSQRGSSRIPVQAPGRRSLAEAGDAARSVVEWCKSRRLRALRRGRPAGSPDGAGPRARRMRFHVSREPRDRGTAPRGRRARPPRSRGRRRTSYGARAGRRRAVDSVWIVLTVPEARPFVEAPPPPSHGPRSLHRRAAGVRR